MKPFHFRQFTLFISVYALTFIAAFNGKAQSSGHGAADTVITTSKNRSTYKIYDKNEQLIKVIHFKNGKKRGSTEIYKNGVLIEKTEFKKGKKNGVWSEYRDSGQLKTIAHYKNDLFSGNYKLYDPSGQLRTDMNYKIFSNDSTRESLLHGKYTAYNHQGDISEKGKYKRGRKIGEWKEYRAGNLSKAFTYADEGKHRMTTFYYPNGQIKQQNSYYLKRDENGELRNAMRDGIQKQYYENGQLEYTSELKMGARDGALKYYYKNGQIRSVQFHSEDEPTGTWQTFEKNGAIKSETNYTVFETDDGRKGLKDGMARGWKNGKLQFEKMYSKGEFNGVLKSYFPDGSLAVEKNYIRGLPQGEAVEYYENGNLKTLEHFGVTYTWQGKPKSIKVGWQYRYEPDGTPRGVVFSDSLGEELIVKTYFEGKIMQYELKRLLSLNYAPGGTFNSMLVGRRLYRPLQSQRYFRDGGIRSITFQNPEKEISNSIYFTYRGKPFSTSSTEKNNPDSLKPGKSTVEKIIEKTGKRFIPNPFYTDSIKNGDYMLRYADGTKAASMQFENDLPDGDFIVYAPLNGDTLLYQHYEMGVLSGYFIQKFGGRQTLLKKEIRPGELPDDVETFFKSGTPQSKKIYQPGDSSITKTEYYPNGQMKTKRNKKRRLSLSFDSDGNPISERYLLPDRPEYSISKTYYPETNQPKQISFLRNRELDSTFTRYYPSGRIWQKATYRDGKQIGKYLEYDTDGSLKRKGFYENGKREGLWVEIADSKTDSAYYENDKRIVKPSVIACQCLDTAQAMGTIGHANKLDYFFDYPTFQSNLPAYLIPVDSLNFRKIFFTRMHSGGGTGNYYFRLNLILFKPFQFKIPANKQIKLTLNPCRTKGYLSQMEGSLSTSRESDYYYARLTPDRFSMEILTGPVASADTNYSHFTAFYSALEMEFSARQRLHIDYNDTVQPCFTKAKIKNFLTLEINDARPYIFEKLDAYSSFTQSITLTDSELREFFGLQISSGELTFRLDNKSTVIAAHSDGLLIGGKYATGKVNLRGSKNKSGNYILTDTSGNMHEISPKDLKLLWLQNGFTRLIFDFDPDKENLEISFFTE